MLFGFARARAMNSGNVFTFSSFDTTTTNAPAPTAPIGCRSFNGLYGSFARIAALVVIEIEVSSSVLPSGIDFATKSVPIVPPAPALFSTMTVCPRRVPSLAASTRAMMSLLAPGVNGTISLMPRFGHSPCALAGANSNAERPAASTARRLRRFGKVISSPA
jgi:hypothetical protein